MVFNLFLFYLDFKFKFPNISFQNEKYIFIFISVHIFLDRIIYLINFLVVTIIPFLGSYKTLKLLIICLILSYNIENFFKSKNLNKPAANNSESHFGYILLQTSQPKHLHVKIEIFENMYVYIESKRENFENKPFSLLSNFSFP